MPVSNEGEFELKYLRDAPLSSLCVAVEAVSALSARE
jgi:hypothetical protein